MMTDKILSSPYQFYEMSEDDRKALVGKEFIVYRKQRPNCKPVKKSYEIYFPVQLADSEFNYGKQQGLIRISDIMDDISNKGKKWMRIAAFSPDDLDIDLDFDDKEVNLRNYIVWYVRNMNKYNVTYRGFLSRIQKHFNAGTRTS